MGRKKNYGRPVSGLLLLNKESGMTSNAALQKAKRLFFANKAGHTGSLDPLATGVLPVCFGEATKFSSYLLNADKRYLATVRLGVATSTADSEGEVLDTRSAASVTAEQVESNLSAFRGDILQVPPMVSALKHNGQPLYKLARQGVEIEREPRPVTVYLLEMLAFRCGEVAELDIEVHCSKGTYIRSIASDLGHTLGMGGHISRLHRSQAGDFTDAKCFTLAQLTDVRGDGPAEILDDKLISIQSALQHIPEITLDTNAGHYFRQGQAIMDSRVYRLGEQGDTVRVCQKDGAFLGIGEITDAGAVAPRRVVVP